MATRRGLILAAIAALVSLVGAASARAGEPSPDAQELNGLCCWELERRLTNPIRPMWSLNFENTVELLQGDDVAGTAVLNALRVEPYLPLVFGKSDSIILALRVTLPLYTVPKEVGGQIPVDPEHITGLGDVEFLRLIGPNKRGGFIWGVGLTSRFPTAAFDQIDQDNYQLGPALQLFYLGDAFVVGTLAQHWMSYSDSTSDADVLRTDVDYTFEARLSQMWSLGMHPRAVLDWNAASGNRYTVPVGLGLTRMTHLDYLPVRLRLEAQYAVVRPDDMGAAWRFQIQIEPVIPNAFR